MKSWGAFESITKDLSSMYNKTCAGSLHTALVRAISANFDD